MEYKSQEEQEAAVAMGPLSFVMCSNVTLLSKYTIDVYSHGSVCEPLENYATNNTNCSGLHAMVLVGYGSLNGVPYWKVRNSWGLTGLQTQPGYWLIERKCALQSAYGLQMHAGTYSLVPQAFLFCTSIFILILSLSFSSTCDSESALLLN